jgi:hypothetical protein
MPGVLNPISSFTGGKKLDIFLGGIRDVGGGREFLLGFRGPFFLVHSSSYVLWTVLVVLKDCCEDLKFLCQ